MNKRFVRALAPLVCRPALSCLFSQLCELVVVCVRVGNFAGDGGTIVLCSHLTAEGLW